MAAYIRVVLEEMFDSDDYEMVTLYERFYTAEKVLKENAHKDFISWVNEIFDLVEVPRNTFRKVIMSNEFIFNTDNIEEFLGAIEANYTEFMRAKAEEEACSD